MGFGLFMDMVPESTEEFVRSLEGDAINLIPIHLSPEELKKVPMNIKVCRVKQYNSSHKSILMIDGEPVMISQGEARIAEALSYIGGNDYALEHDKSMQRKLSKYRGRPIQDTNKHLNEFVSKYKKRGKNL